MITSAKVRSGARLTAVLLLAVVLAVLVDYGYSHWRAYEGYCEQTGEKLSTARRFDVALEDYLRNQQTADLLEIRAVEDREELGLDQLNSDFTLHHYASREQFLADNPDCCPLTWSLPEGERLGWWQRAKDSGDGYFHFRHKVRYTGPDGARKEIVAERVYYQITNCGHARLRVF